MSSLLKKTLTLVTITSFSSLGFLEAYCSKCVKIEENRAKEQAAHPQQAGYYEDFQVNLSCKHTSQTQEAALADDRKGSYRDIDNGETDSK